MQKHLIVEEVLSETLYILEPGCVKFNSDESYPLTLGLNFEDVDDIIGKVTNLRRTDKNIIDGDIEFLEKARQLKPGDFNISFYANEVIGTTDHETEKKTIQSCKLRSFALIPIIAEASPTAPSSQ